MRPPTAISVNNTLADLLSSLHQSHLLLLISFVVPLVSVLLISSVIVRNAWDIHNSVLSVLMSYTVAGFVTQIIKITVGRPRPDLIDRASFFCVSS